MISAKWDERSVLTTKEILKALALKPAKRKRLLWRVAKNIATESKRNIRQQRTPDGKAWEPRKNRRKGQKKKMLLGLQRLIVVSGQSNQNSAKITLNRGSYKSGMHGAALGSVHSKGQTVTRTKNSTKRLNKSKKGYCTRKQAKALKDLGYKVRARRINPDAPANKWKSPTIAWMTKNVKQSQVSYLFITLQEKAGLTKEGSWVIDLPSRKFMGASRTKVRKAWERAFQSIDYGWDVRAKNIK